MKTPMFFLKAKLLLVFTLLPLPSILAQGSRIPWQYVGSGFGESTDGTLRYLLGQNLVGSSQGSLNYSAAGFFAYSLRVGNEGGRWRGTPPTYHLDQNYPNPFNPRTTIRFALAVSAKVQIKLFDVLGRELVTVIEEDKSDGTYAVILDASGLASGVYFYRMHTTDENGHTFTEAKKLVVLK